MAILNIQPYQPAGQVGVSPYWISIETNDTLATVTTAGYLTNVNSIFGFSFTNQQMALVQTSDSGVIQARVSATAGGVVSLTAVSVSGTTAAYAGGGTSNAFTATGLTASMKVTASLTTSTNNVALTTVVPGTNTLTVGFTADPGANTTVTWIAKTA